MKNKNIVQSQLTLGIENQLTRSCSRPPRSRSRRRTRAAMWFNHMRRIVDDAQDWPVSPTNHPAHSFPQ